MKSILIIGNGFDLAHGLPTSYENFLEFINDFKKNKHQLNRTISVEFAGLIEDNTWVNYFENIYKNKMEIGEDKWIDFEGEISNIVKSMEEARKQIVEGIMVKMHKHERIQKRLFIQLKPFLEPRIQGNESPVFTIQSFNDKKAKIMEDLNKLTRCLEIYLAEVVENETVKVKLPDIDDINADYVLSFNYTNTFEKIYESNSLKDIEYDYIHGEANINHTTDTCNLVLGVDEYLDSDEKNKNTEFIQFKKYYQRIYKKTGSEYKNWIRDLKEPKSYTSNVCDGSKILAKVYVFGHSLGDTDKDVLKELINTEGVIVTIYYHNKQALGELISNMVKLIGQDNLIERVHGGHATIKFRKQRAAVDIC